MIQKCRVLGIALVVLIFAFLVLNVGSAYENIMAAFSGTVDSFREDSTTMKSDEIQSSNVVSDAQTKVFKDFAAKFKAADRYSFSCTKKITGDAVPFISTFSCSVDGNDYAISAPSGESKLRQLYVNGKYNLVDDTTRVVYKDVSYIIFPDLLLDAACAGKILRVKDDIIDGEPVRCFELYADGVMYEIYFSQQGKIISYYSISDNYEMKINFTEFDFNKIEKNAFTIQPGYFYYENSRFNPKLFESTAAKSEVPNV